SPFPKINEFQDWYNSVFPFKRFNLDDTNSMYFETNVNKGEYNLIYKEILTKKGEDIKYILDFDGSIKNIKINEYLDRLDEIYKLVHDEWEIQTIKNPVKEYMNREG
ncbi:MAG: hypothetical protein ACFFCS_24665, partial [Candidatus Hodarchaeota archaeon]